MEKTDSGRPDEVLENKTPSRKKTASGSGSNSRSRKKRRGGKADPGRYLIARLLGLVCLVLVVFEGNVIYRLFSHRVGTSVEIMNTASNPQTEGLLTDSAAADTAVSTQEDSLAGSGSSSVVALAGGDLAEAEPQADIPSGLFEEPTSSESIDSAKVVKPRSPSVDDSYFNNAVFIGDSRMEGFRNSSGITQGTFLTGVGLAVNDMDKQIISTADGNVSVYQGLSGHQYDKIYLMLGANDLGYYPWDDFLPVFRSVLQQFHELQPNAIIYVCSVIYVDETKIAPGFEYDNNDNVRTINGYILEACEELWYAWYLNLNEIFSDGYGELISDASSDGIHLYANYLSMMLDYLKAHYITEEEFAQEKANHPDDISNLASDEASDAEEGGAGDDSFIGSDDSGSDDDASDGIVSAN